MEVMYKDIKNLNVNVVFVIQTVYRMPTEGVLPWW